MGKTQGGAQLQISLLAKALASKGHEVVVIDPFLEENFKTAEGISVINVPNWNTGIRGLRFFFNRVPALFKIFKAQNADYYYVRMRYYLYLVPFLTSRQTNTKFILSIACDIDVLGLYKKYTSEYKGNIGFFKYLSLALPNDLVFKYLLKRADIVAFQHNDQKKLAGKLPNKGIIFPNIIDLKQFESIECTQKCDYYIYVGSLTKLKGAAKLLNLIQKSPHVSFLIVGKPRDNESEAVYEQLKKYSNVTLKGWLNHEQTLTLIAGAKALINTSFYEGFPNIFLESWACGVPVISLNVNPDNILNKHKLGVCCEGDLQKMQSVVENGKFDECEPQKLRSYVAEFHNFETAAERFMALL